MSETAAEVDHRAVLEQGLSVAAEYYRERSLDDREDIQRASARIALGTVVEYLWAIGVDRRLCAPLMALEGALTDASNGIRNAILEPAAYNPAAPRKGAIDVWTATLACVAIELLMRAGERPEDAFREAAGAIGRPALQLREFRKNLRCGRATESAAAMYQILRRQQAEHQGPDARIAAGALLKNAAALSPRPREKV